MKSLAYIPGSNQAANASLMTVQNVRAAGASDIIVNTVTGAPAKFYGSMGAPHTFIDPVTGETITIISEATAVDFAAHLDSGKVVIDAIAPGYVDTRGSLVGDIVVIRPITEWANNIFNVLSESHNDDGTLKESAITYEPTATDFVETGGIVSLVSGLNGAMTALTGYITGRRGTVAAIASRAYTASKDTYVDILRNTTTGVFTVVYKEVTLGATSPALAANSLRLAKVITSGAAITSIQQYGVDAVTTNGQVNYFRNTSPTAAPIFVFQNVGTAAGSFWYRNQNGIKEMWGLSGNNSVTSTPQTRGLDTPAGFFNSIISANVGVFQVGAQQSQYAILQGFGASGGILTQWANSNGTQVASLYVRGY